MILPDKKIKETGVVFQRNDAKQPKGTIKYFASVWFTDDSHLYSSNIYAKSRANAFKKAIAKFKDSLNYIKDISVLECDY